MVTDADLGREVGVLNAPVLLQHTENLAVDGIEFHWRFVSSIWQLTGTECQFFEKLERERNQPPHRQLYDAAVPTKASGRNGMRVKRDVRWLNMLQVTPAFMVVREANCGAD